MYVDQAGTRQYARLDPEEPGKRLPYNRDSFRWRGLQRAWLRTCELSMVSKWRGSQLCHTLTAYTLSMTEPLAVRVRPYFVFPCMLSLNS
jgi:hypothetical protein